MTKHISVDYTALTINDANPIKRRLQNSRLNHSLHNFKPNGNVSVLDYGTGDGELCLRINDCFPNTSLYAYEPSDDLRKQTESKLSNIQNIKISGSTNVLPDQSFDYLFCLEVFEHLTEETTLKEFTEFKRLIRPGGKIIIGVPNEVYFAALFKGALRIKRRFGTEDGSLINILKSAAGFPPKKRTISEFDGLPYIIRHMGFDYRKFRKQLAEHFTIDKSYCSPFPGLPLLFNLEVYFICSLK